MTLKEALPLAGGLAGGQEQEAKIQEAQIILWKALQHLWPKKFLDISEVDRDDYRMRIFEKVIKSDRSHLSFDTDEHAKNYLRRALYHSLCSEAQKAKRERAYLEETSHEIAQADRESLEAALGAEDWVEVADEHIVLGDKIKSFVDGACSSLRTDAAVGLKKNLEGLIHLKLEDVSQDELCLELGITISALHRRHTRTRRYLSEYLQTIRSSISEGEALRYEGFIQWLRRKREKRRSC